MITGQLTLSMPVRRKISYFKPRTASTLRWSSKEQQLLLEGLAELGFGHWCDIRRNKLREWDEVEIRLKAARLIGKQDLSEYNNMKLSLEQIQEEKAKNEAAAKAAGKWLGGVLVEENMLPPSP